MNTLLWILAGVLAYSVLAVGLRAAGVLPDSVRVQGPLVTVHTKRGRDFLDWLARPRRFWRAWSNVGVGIALVIMVGTFLLLVQRGVSILQNPPEPTAVNNPQNVLVIPGVNEFLPLAVAPEIVLGLLIGLVVHEGGHGLLCRVEGIDIESMGLVLLTVLPVGAFVEPNEESQRRASRGGRTRMFAAGVTNNFAVTLLAFVLLFGPVAGSIAVQPGAAVGGVFEKSSAAQAGIDQGDRIVAIDGQAVESNDQLNERLAAAGDANIRVTVVGTDGERRTTTVSRSLLVTSMAPDSPLSRPGPAGVDTNDTVVAIDGTQVNTESEFDRAVRDAPVATVETADGRTVSGPVGVMVTASPDGPLASTGLPTDERFVVTRIDDTRTLTFENVRTALEGKGAGETVTVQAYHDGQLRTYDVTLGSNQNVQGGFLGVNFGADRSGIGTSSLGVKTYPAPTFLGILSGAEVGSLFQRTLTVLLLPFIGAVFPTLEFNFAGFVGWNTNFYAVQGPLSVLGGGVFLLANTLFWVGWVNLNLGFFNCIPAFPLDGGRILRTATESVIARLPVERKWELTRAVTTSVGLIMLVSLLLLLFGPQLLN